MTLREPRGLRGLLALQMKSSLEPLAGEKIGRWNDREVVSNKRFIMNGEDKTSEKLLEGTENTGSFG